MLDSEQHGWPVHELRPATFEVRISEVMLPKTASAEIGAPDLMVVSSLFWDEKFMNDYERDFRPLDRGSAVGFLYNQIAWHRSRGQEIVAYLRELYGPRLPIMYRTRHLRKMVGDSHVLHIFQLDQSWRTICNALGLKLFTWGDKMEGFYNFYDEDQHYPLGPNTYLFGDMTFYYLHRALTRSCWFCQG